MAAGAADARDEAIVEMMGEGRSGSALIKTTFDFVTVPLWLSKAAGGVKADSGAGIRKRMCWKPKRT
jgi:hypothetical protein